MRGQRYELEKQREGRPEKRCHTDTVSGRTREQLADEYGVSPRTIMRDAEFARAVDTITSLKDSGFREAALNWIIDNQLGRRNLAPEERSYLRGKRYNLEKKGHGGDRRSDSSIPENQGLNPQETETAERLAIEYGVSRDTIEKDGQFAEAVDTLERKVRKDLREVALRRSTRPASERFKSNNLFDLAIEPSALYVLAAKAAEGRNMATVYEQIVQEVEKRAGELVRKRATMTQAEAIREVLNGDRALYERYRAASLEPQPPASLAKRGLTTDDSPGAQIVGLAKAYHPEDPFGAGLDYVRQTYPQLWRQYRQDYA